MSLIFNFPEEFRYKVDSISDDGLSIKLYAEIKDVTSLETWVSSYSRLTNTRWIVSKSRKDCAYFACRKFYVCKFIKHKKTSSSKLNFDYKAFIDIKIQYINADSRYKYQHIKENLPATISINLHHSHDVASAEALSYLAPSSATFDRFQCYFNSNLDVAASMRKHATFLQEEMGGVESVIVNATHNPKQRTVQNWYAKWKQNNLGDFTGHGMMKKLDDTVVALEKVEDCTTTVTPQSTSNTLEQPSTSTFISTSERDRIEIIQKFVDVFYKKLIELKVTVSDMEAFSLKLSKIKTPSEMSAFLNDCCNFVTIDQDRRPINVQPTAVTRRRSGVTRGNNRPPSGTLSRVSMKKKKNEIQL